MTVLTSIFAFIAAIGILVAIHEYGHFWVARRCGVKVLKFSIGFGKPLWSKTGKDGVEYIIAAIPLGGYVKMLDEREAPVAEAEQHLAFNRQNVWKRIAIVIAGPAANFLFAIAAFWVIFINGVPGLQPVIAQPPQDSVAAIAGLNDGDKIIAVGDRSVTHWAETNVALLTAAISDPEVLVTIESAETQSRRTTNLDVRALADDPETGLQQIGLSPWLPTIPAIIGQVVEPGAAKQAGLEAGDQILAINNQETASWQDLVAIIQANPASNLDLLVERNGVTKNLILWPESRSNDNGSDIGFAGIAPHISDELKSELQKHQITIEHGFFDSLVAANQRVWETSKTILVMMFKMVTGQASLKHLGGPLNIAQYAGASADAGIISFISFLAFISISLGVLNLLPVPVLDGGHLLYYVCELLLGRPLSDTAQAIGQRFGLAFIMLLMTVALFNDFSRLL